MRPRHTTTSRPGAPPHTPAAPTGARFALSHADRRRAVGLPATGRHGRTNAGSGRPTRCFGIVLIATVAALLGVALTTAGRTPAVRPVATAAPLPGAAAVTPVPLAPVASSVVPAPAVPVSCPPGSSPACALPTTSAVGAAAPPVTATTAATPCTGENCIPQPTTGSTSTGTDGGTSTVPGLFGGDSCSPWDPSTWMDCLVHPIVTDAINSMVTLLAITALSTPTPDSIPEIGVLWTNSWQIMLASYGLIVLIAGVVVMAYGSLHTRHSAKELAPRVAVGFLAGSLSLFLATKAIELANALAYALLDGAGNSAGAGRPGLGTAIGTAITGMISAGIWPLLMGLLLVGMITAVLVGYLVRVTLTILLIASAPILLMFHALPGATGIAAWLWRMLGGLLAIQVAQSLVLAIAVRILLTPVTANLFGGA